MKTPDNCENMTDIRAAIDDIDRQIVALVGQRAGYVTRAAAFKKNETAVRDSVRVERVIASKKELALQYGAAPQLIEQLYRLMIDFFINEELQKWKEK